VDIKLYNSLGKREEVFKPINSGKVGLYSCGPTVYFTAHIGNFRSFILSDIVRRIFEFNGYEVKQVMNITDVGHLTDDADQGEDKVLVEAIRQGKSMQEVAGPVIAQFEKDLASLKIKKPHHMPKASEHIPQMIKLIEKLFENGLVYILSDGIYFDTQRIENYGKLATVDMNGLLAGARVEVNSEKRHPFDFAVWKFSKSDKKGMSFETEWGWGYPGWHIECSAMSREYLGQPFDIHTGGVDHVNVHHTNEIAQSEGAFGIPLANYWLHGEFLLSGESKMSKSEGSLYTLEDLEKEGISALEFRYFTFTAHYRTQLKFSLESLKATATALRNLKNELSEFPTPTKPDESYLNLFNEGINNDLNMPQALSVLWQMMRSSQDKAIIHATLLKMDEVLGLDLNTSYEISESVQQLVKEREKARLKNDWKESDRLRKLINMEGFEVEDTSEGQKLKYVATITNVEHN